MGSDDWFVLVIVIVLFAIGYIVVSYLVDKVRPHRRITDSREAQRRSWEQSRTDSHGAKDDPTRAKRTESDTHEHQHRPQEETPHGNEACRVESDEERYAQVLGLKANASPSEVKRAYHDQLMKYHPDKVSHLGDEFKIIAEIKTREILAAYNYFRRKYDIQ